MQLENTDDFFDVSIRNKKFGRVDTLNGPRILEKYGLDASCCVMVGGS
jgi:hypothetical protein